VPPEREELTVIIPPRAVRGVKPRLGHLSSETTHRPLHAAGGRAAASCRAHRVPRPALLTLVLALGTASAVRAQGARLPALIEQIAGTEIYLHVGIEQGVTTADTLAAFLGSTGGDPVGRFVVIAAATTRSVVTFAGPPFAVTRGATLYLAVSRPAPAAPLVDQAPRRRAAEEQSRSPSLRGRLALETNAFESTARWTTNDPEQARRRFVTPSAALRADLTDLPGGWSLHTSVRAAYRYSQPDIISPRTDVRVYQASVAQGTPGSPVYFEMGRFLNPFVTAGGYWDGMVVHTGGDGLGLGAAVGFEPERGNQTLSTTLPKYGAFLTYRAGTGSTRYASDLAFHQVRPRDGLPTHTYLGWSQALRVRRFRLSHQVQVDRDPERDRWAVTRLNGAVGVPLATGLELQARVAMTQPYAFWRAENLITFRRDQGTLGLSYWSRAASLNADVTLHHVAGGAWGHTFGGSFGFPRAVAGVGWSGAATYWTQGTLSGLYLASTLDRSFGRVLWRAGYQQDRSTGTGDPLITHSGDLGLSFPLSRRVVADLRGRVQRGASLTSRAISLSLWSGF
jgi:hypothetical protein